MLERDGLPAKEDEALLNAAYDRVAEALEQGELVGIFPLRRGVLSRIGLEAAAPLAPAAATPEALQATVAALRGDWL